MHKRGRLLSVSLVLLIALFLTTINAVQAQPAIGDSSCVTYAQARAQGIKGTDAELRQMGFCAGISVSTQTQTTTQQTQKTGVEYSEGDERDSDSEQGYQVDYSARNKWDDYYKDKTDEELNGGDKVEYQTIWDALEECERINDEKVESCQRACGEYDECGCYDTWLPGFEQCQKDKREREDAYARKVAAMMREYDKALSIAAQLPSIKETGNYDSAELMELVAGRHNEEVEEIQNYYARPPAFPGVHVDEEAAIDKFNNLRPLSMDLLDAKQYYDKSLQKGMPSAELESVKAEYDSKISEMKAKLQEVLDDDYGNADALWQLGTLAKWEGDTRASYEYYRNALIYSKSRNPFKYKIFMNAARDPETKKALLQSLEPKKTVIEIPTVDTSPLLNELKQNLNVLIQPLSDEVKGYAFEIEKMSRAFSINRKIEEVKQELGISPVGEKDDGQ